MSQNGERKDVKVMITAETLIPEMVTKYPATRKVLDKYGLKGCGGPSGPREPVAWFARLHNVPLQQLLDELNQAARESLESEKATFRFEPTIADVIYQPFFASAAAFAVVFGGLWGAVSLAVMGITGDMQFAVPYGWLLAHGQGMLGGFVALMAMGFAYQAFPRFKHSELQLPKLAIAVLPLMLVGLSFQIIAHFFVPANIFQVEKPSISLWALALGTFGALLQLAAITLFIVVIFVTLRKAKKPEPHDPFVYASFAWLWLSALANTVLFVYWGTISNSEEFIHRVGTWNASLRDAQMFGFATQLILGVSLRFLPHAYGFKEPHERWAKLLFVGINFAVLVLVCSFPLLIITRHHIWAAIYWFAILSLFVLTIIHIRQIRLFGPSQESDRALKFIRAAFAWAVVGMLMGLALPIYHALTDQNFSHNYLAAYRHALLAGFVLPMIVGVSSKVTPILSGVDLKRTNPLWTVFVLLNLGNIGRIIGQVAFDLTTERAWLGVLMAASGFAQWAGILLWADDLWNTIATGRRIAREELSSPEELMEITPQTKVAAVLERYPQTLKVFLKHGFAPLANPVLRKTMAKVVTIEQACRREGVDLETLLADLRKAAGLSENDQIEEPKKPDDELTEKAAKRFHADPNEATDFTEKLIWSALEGCYDPEIPDANIVELGLVYGVHWDKGNGVAEILMTLTSPHCPIGGYIVEQVRQSVGSVPGVKEVVVELTFDPPWSLERIKPEVRQRLGLEW